MTPPRRGGRGHYIGGSLTAAEGRRCGPAEGRSQAEPSWGSRGCRPPWRGSRGRSPREPAEIWASQMQKSTNQMPARVLLGSVGACCFGTLQPRPQPRCMPYRGVPQCFDLYRNPRNAEGPHVTWNRICRNAHSGLKIRKSPTCKKSYLVGFDREVATPTSLSPSPRLLALPRPAHLFLHPLFMRPCRCSLVTSLPWGVHSHPHPHPRSRCPSDHPPCPAHCHMPTPPAGSKNGTCCAGSC